MATKSVISFQVSTDTDFLSQLKSVIENNDAYSTSGFSNSSNSPLTYQVQPSGHLIYQILFTATLDTNSNTVTLSQSGNCDGYSTPIPTELIFNIDDNVDVLCYLHGSELLILNFLNTTNSTQGLLGLIVPSQRPEYWTIGSYAHCLYFNNPILNSASDLHFLSVTNVPFASGTNSWDNCSYRATINNPDLIGANELDGNIDILTGIIVFNPQGNGVYGKLSNQLGIGAFASLNVGNIITTTVNNTDISYEVLRDIAGGLCVQVPTPTGGGE